MTSRDYLLLLCLLAAANTLNLVGYLLNGNAGWPVVTGACAMLVAVVLATAARDWWRHRP